MINLMPPEVKRGYGFARRNVGLRRWVFILLFTFVGLGAIATYGLLSIQQSTNQYDQQIAESEAAFKKQNFDEVQRQIQDITSSFKLAVEVLSKEILFSELLKQIGTTMPRNANLTNLSISQTQGGIDITANATDYNTATQVQVNLADPANKIFNKADIVSINCGGSDTPGYPCSVTIRALFGANNPFLLINQGKAAKS